METGHTGPPGLLVLNHVVPDKAYGNGPALNHTHNTTELIATEICRNGKAVIQVHVRVSSFINAKICSFE